MSDKNTKNNTAIETVDNKNSYEVASQWKLMWWKFKKHKAAMIAVPVLIIMYLICMCCEFFGPSQPLERYKDFKDTAPTTIHLWDDEGNFQGPFVYGMERYTDPYTYRKSYVENDEIIKLGFFVRGSEYDVFSIDSIQWDIHFFGVILEDGTAIADIKKGDYIVSMEKIESETTGHTWYDVVMEDGTTGYVLKDYVEDKAPDNFEGEWTYAGYIIKDTEVYSDTTRELPGDKAFFLMGTDSLGRDVFSRILSGGRISLSFCLVSVFFTVAIGLTLGGLSGYLGGIVDTIVQRAIDLIMSIPGIPMWMALAAALPSTMSNLKKYFLMSLIMSLIGWTGLARVTRGKILSLREEDFVIAARMCGSSHFRVIFKHMLPSFLSYIIVSVTGSIPGTILGETSLSFLGLGLQAPTVSWGTMMQDCQTVDSMAATPWLMFPALFIIISVLCFCFMGDGLRDAADPYK